MFPRDGHGGLGRASTAISVTKVTVKHCFWTLLAADIVPNLTLRRPAGAVSIARGNPRAVVGYTIVVAILRDAALRAAPQDEVVYEAT
jgi:hypothetical protein